MYWEAARECRCSGSRRSIGGIREIWGFKGVLGPLGSVRGVLGDCRESRYPGARRSIGASEGIGAC